MTEQAQEAKTYKQGYICQGYLNSWLGPNILSGDKIDQTRHGKLFKLLGTKQTNMCK